MSAIKCINYANIDNSRDIYYFGWAEDELSVWRKQYQSKYYGSVNDAGFENIDDEGNIYYIIFRTPAEDDWFVNKTKNYLVFKDQKRMLINVAGQLYRYLINEKKLLNNSCYEGITCNSYSEANSPYFHSISSAVHEIMVVVDNEGVAAINWNGILWGHKFEWAYSGYLELTKFHESEVIAEYYDPTDSFSPYHLIFDIQTGAYKKEKLLKSR